MIRQVTFGFFISMMSSCYNERAQKYFETRNDGCELYHHALLAARNVKSQTSLNRDKQCSGLQQRVTLAQSVITPQAAWQRQCAGKLALRWQQ